MSWQNNEPVRLPNPELTWWDRIRIALVGDWTTRAAEIRWTRSNRVRLAAGCPCGRPAEFVMVDHGTSGRVPFEVPACAEHVGVVMWESVNDGPKRPAWPRATRCDGCGVTVHCSGTVSNNADGQIVEYCCPVRPVEFRPWFDDLRPVTPSEATR